VDRAQNDIVSVTVVLHQSGFPQIMHGHLREARLYPVALIPTDVVILQTACRSYSSAGGNSSPEMGVRGAHSTSLLVIRIEHDR